MLDRDPRTWRRLSQLRGFDQGELRKVYVTLRVAAERLVGGADRTVDSGWSAEDLASETLKAFFASPTALGWDEGRTPRLEIFLLGVMRKKAKDRFRHQQHIACSVDDPNSGFQP